MGEWMKDQLGTHLYMHTHTHEQIYNPSAKDSGIWYTLDKCSEENTRVASQVIHLK